MKTKSYLILFVVLSGLVILASWWKIEHRAYANIFLGIVMLGQAALIISYIVQSVTTKNPND